MMSISICAPPFPTLGGCGKCPGQSNRSIPYPVWGLALVKLEAASALTEQGFQGFGVVFSVALCYDYSCASEMYLENQIQQGSQEQAVETPINPY